MSIATKFEEFNKNLRISTSKISTISARYKSITKRLNIDFRNSSSETSNSLYVGSYGRDTEIFTSDIDMLFILPYSVYQQYDNYETNGQSALLQAVKQSIEKTYSVTRLKADGQVIIVPFDDKIIFEVVPCFTNDNDSFTFPNSNDGGSWKTTNPKPEIQEIKDENIRCNKNLKRLCRMVRAWKEKWDVPIGGLLIDTLAYNFLKNWEYKEKSYLYYDFMVKDFFEYLKSQDSEQNYWLVVGSNQYVWRTGKFEYKALRCFNIAEETIKYENDKLEYSANLQWKEIFGTKFTG